MMPGDKLNTMGHNTASRLWCALAEAIDVTMMVASDVASAICMTCCGWKLLMAEDKIQDWNNDQATADAQQAGRQAGNCTCKQIQYYFSHDMQS